MNGTQKFHKATGPAFNAGEVWYAADGSKRSVTIVGVRAYNGNSVHNSDYEVTYTWTTGSEVHTNEKDAWNFQVRYYHQADANLRVTKPRD